MNKKVSSKSITTNAARTLKSNHSSSIQKTLAGSVLSQRSAGKQTSKRLETISSRVLKSNKYAEQTKSYAASVLSQSEK